MCNLVYIYACICVYWYTGASIYVYKPLLIIHICAYACVGILVLDAPEGSPAQKAGLRSTVRTAAGGIALG